MCPAVGSAAIVGRRHTWVPPYREICKTCVGAAALPRPSTNTAFSQNVIPRSAATWESVFPLRQSTVREEYGLPHQPAGWFAMTGFLTRGTVRFGGGVRAPRPTHGSRVRCVVDGGASGKSAKRRQRRMKRAGFEEVPRLVATTVGGNRLARRWAVAAPYGCGATFNRAGQCGERIERRRWRVKQKERATARVAPYAGTVVFPVPPLHFSPFCGILVLSHFKIKEFSPWKP